MSTSEEAIEPGDLRRWNLSIIKEYLKRIWMAMGGESDRGAIDYDARRDERIALTSVLRDLLKEIRNRPPPSLNNGDGSGDIKKWIAGLGLVISGAFVIGGWVLSNTVAGQSVQILNLTEQVREQNARIARIENDRR